MPQSVVERTSRGVKVGTRDVATGSFITVSGASVGSAPRNAQALRKREMAVLNYIRTVRSLGKTRVTSGDVADALGLDERDVRRIMLSLQREGVKAR